VTNVTPDATQAVFAARQAGRPARAGLPRLWWLCAWHVSRFGSNVPPCELTREHTNPLHPLFDPPDAGSNPARPIKKRLQPGSTTIPPQRKAGGELRARLRALGVSDVRAGTFSQIAVCVARAGDECAYGCAYRLVSVSYILLQFVASTIRTSCSEFPSAAVRFSLLSRTFNS
jgi:hypothetical protein